MWKYVTRRIRDSVERTCNVLESRRTWTCGGAEKNNNSNDPQQQQPPPPSDGPPTTILWPFESSAQQQQQQQSGSCAVSRPSIRAVVPYQRPYESSHDSGSSSSSSGDRQYQWSYDDFHRHEPHFHPHHSSVLGALTWSGAIVAGWYTSQLLCMRRRRQQQLWQFQQSQQQLHHQQHHHWLNGPHGHRCSGTAAANAALSGSSSGGGGVSGCPYTWALGRQLRRQPGPLSCWVRRSQKQHQQQAAAVAAGGQPQEQRLQQKQRHDDVWLERILSAANIKDYRNDYQAALREDRDGLLSEHVFQLKHDIDQQVPKSREGVESGDAVDGCQQQESPVTAGAPPADRRAAQTIPEAVRDLLQVVGDIEFQLGVQHMLAKRYDMAARHFKLATSHQHVGATFNLGLCYEHGHGVGRDDGKALECYVIAAGRGHAKALFNLGVFHGQGRAGLQRNRRVARECFVAAARLGQVDARRALGMPLDGEEVPIAVAEEEEEVQSNGFALVAVENRWKCSTESAPLSSDIFQAAVVMA